MTDRLGEALAILSTEDGLLNEIDRHNAEVYVAAVAEAVAAARNWHTLPPVWEQAHRLRDALLDSFNDHEIRTMAELFELVMDDGVTQAWVRALTVTATEDQ